MGADSVAISFGPGLFAGFVLVAFMGVAIQRGSTCLVAAVDEVVTDRTARRLRAIALAGLLSGALMAIAGPTAESGPAAPALSTTAIGAMLLGVGAVVNRACIVGTVARIGSGEWAFLFTPAGIVAASLVLADFPSPPGSGGPAHSSAAAGPGAILLLLFVGAATALASLRGERMTSEALWPRLRSPHVATAVIGILFALLSLIATPWSYADSLGVLARTGMAEQPGLHLGLVGILLASARLAGRADRKTLPSRPTLSHCIRCFLGGAIMTAGAMLVPGSNDMLLLQGAPMLHPHALLALPIMAGTIACILLMRHRFRLK